MRYRPSLKDGRLQHGIIRHVRAETFGMAEPDLPPLARSFDRDPARVDFILIDLLAAEAAGTPSDFTPAGPSATRPTALRQVDALQSRVCTHAHIKVDWPFLEAHVAFECVPQSG
jgi:hypothetical protein